MTVRHNDKWKRNVAVTLFQYVMQTYHKKESKNEDPTYKVMVSYFRTSFA